jgi:hypothetical protein
MQLNITDEMIEQIVREQVKARVNQYFGELKKENSFFMIDQIKNAIRVCAQEEVENILNEGYVNKICYDLAKSNLKDQIVESFASRIVSAFDD